MIQLCKKISMLCVVACLGFYCLVLFVTNIPITIHDAFFICCQDEPETAINLGRFTPSTHVYHLALGAVLFVVSAVGVWVAILLYSKARIIGVVRK